MKHSRIDLKRFRLCCLALGLAAVTAALRQDALGQVAPSPRKTRPSSIARLFDSLEALVTAEAARGQLTEVWLAYARLHEVAGSLDSAQSLLLRLSDRSPHLDSLISNGWWRYELPWSYHALLPGESVTAPRERSTDELVVRLFPNSAEAWSDLGKSRGRDGDLPGGLSAHDRAITLEPGSLQRKIYKAETLGRYGTYELARAYYDSLLQATGMKSEEVFWSLADLERARGTRAVAAEAYKNGFVNHNGRENPFLILIHGDSAVALITEQLGQAVLLDVLKTARMADTTDGPLNELLGDAYMSDSNYTEALSTYRSAAAIRRSGVRSFKVGSALFHLERFEEASRAFREAFAQDTTSPAAMFNVGASLGNLSRYAESRRAYAEYVIRRPEDPDGWVRLGWSTHQIGGREPEVASYFERAVALNPGVFDDNPEGRLTWERAVRKVGEQRPATVTSVKQLVLGDRPTRGVSTTPSSDPKSGEQLSPLTRPKRDLVKASGSGFAVGSSGEVITNWHVIKGCGSLRVKSINGVKSSATVLGKDEMNDLALLRVPELVATPLSFRGSSVRAGESVVTMGFPLAGVLATQPVNATGTVSALAGLGNDARILQISAPVQAGNSGGPVLDQTGAIIGVVVSKLDAVRVYQATGDIPQNVNFAIKGTIARSFLEANGVTPRISPPSVERSTPDVVQMGRMGTVAIECMK